MTFEEVVEHCRSTPEFVEQFDRLTGGRLARAAKPLSPIERMVDAATGFDKAQDAELRAVAREFVEFVFAFVWLRAPR